MKPVIVGALSLIETCAGGPKSEALDDAETELLPPVDVAEARSADKP